MLVLGVQGAGARQDGLGATIAVAGRAAFTYRERNAVDARGRAVPATLIAGKHTLTIRLSDRGARYPLLVDPLVQQSQLTGPAGNFGASVAVSADGNTALVGAPAAQVAWVFVRSNGTWTNHGQLAPTGSSPPASFGQAVALSADGNTALVGAPFSGKGSVWVFARKNGTWTQQGPNLTGSD